MKVIERDLKSIIDHEYLDYAMYTLENRAIPSAIDGFKPVHRKLVYAMHQFPNPTKQKVKLVDLASISRYNYHHGEASAAAAAITLTATWNNNCPVFTGHGNFGSRLVQEAAAPRYIYATLSQEFSKYFVDSEVAPRNQDQDNPEPAHYLPTIPWVLVNGISGIAVGFSTNIQPRSVSDLTEHVKLYLSDPKKYLSDKPSITPTFPGFTGKVKFEDNTWTTTGEVKYIGKYTYKITELPWGWDRAEYIQFLNDLVDSGKIKEYDDLCSDRGFEFDVKVSGETREKIDADPIKFFKLKGKHSENLTTLGIDGKLKIFDHTADLIAYFCEYRLKKFDDKLFYDRNKTAAEIQHLKDKIRFIKLVVSGSVDFQRTSKMNLLKIIEDQITAESYGKTFVSIPLYTCTTDEVKDLETKLKAEEAKLIKLNKTTAKQLYMSHL